MAGRDARDRTQRHAGGVEVVLAQRAGDSARCGTVDASDLDRSPVEKCAQRGAVGLFVVDPTDLAPDAGDGVGVTIGLVWADDDLGCGAHRASVAVRSSRSNVNSDYGRRVSAAPR